MFAAPVHSLSALPRAAPAAPREYEAWWDELPPIPEMEAAYNQLCAADAAKERFDAVVAANSVPAAFVEHAVLATMAQPQQAPARDAAVATARGDAAPSSDATFFSPAATFFSPAPSSPVSPPVEPLSPRPDDAVPVPDDGDLMDTDDGVVEVPAPPAEAAAPASPMARDELRSAEFAPSSPIPDGAAVAPAPTPARPTLSSSDGARTSVALWHVCQQLGSAAVAVSAPASPVPIPADHSGIPPLPAGVASAAFHAALSHSAAPASPVSSAPGSPLSVGSCDDDDAAQAAFVDLTGGDDDEVPARAIVDLTGDDDDDVGPRIVRWVVDLTMTDDVDDAGTLAPVWA